ncbi:DNA-binding protein [Streptomyces sp. p1417]|uniref:DNA-binding protein n=1 Tax=Streptomyces typhae TaxID=2681492 RepID=A0A6L6WRS3_9ACTN|nr:ComEA family DNA-binding protein [Streptomyces typhae]MVO84407.1 DNA-binding protein [Streptomyces typhae]
MTRRHARRRARRRRAAAEAMRLRAETLFAEPGLGPGAGPGPEPGLGPGTVAGTAARADPGILPRTHAGAEPEPPTEPSPEPRAEPVAEPPSWRTRAGLAVRERLPVWLRLRCGVERRNVVALGLVLVVAAVFAAQHFWSGRTQSVPPPEVVGAAGQGGEAEPSPAPGTPPGTPSGTSPGPDAGTSAAGTGGVVVDVGGKVHDPGVRRLPAGSRVADALRAAGGVRAGVRTDGLNRARLLVDGEQLVVGAPAPAGVGSGPGGGAPGPVPSGPGTAGSGGSTGAEAGSTGAVAGSTGTGTGPVGLNTATVEQLDTLPGVGPVLARHIIDYRTEHGGFRSVDELREVNGIGEKRFADLQNLVRP